MPLKTHDELIRMVDEYRSTSETNLTQGAIDYDYYDGKQLTNTERSALTDRGQPDIVVNRIQVAVNGILGVMAKTHTDPKAWPRTEQDEGASSTATDILRYVSDASRFKRKKIECFKDNLLGGVCAVLVGASKKGPIPLMRIRWEEFIYDTRSREVDFSDATWMGIAKWMFADDIEAKYKGKGKGDGQDGGGTGGFTMTDDIMGDRPTNQGWLNDRKRRALVAEIYYREGSKWFKAVIWYGGILEQGPSPYKDEHGTPTNPIVAVSCYVDRENNRYGVVRNMRDLQDEINKRRSKLLHIINSSQIEASDPSAIEVDADAARREAARPDGVLPYGWKKVSTQDMAQGQMLLLTEAKNELERFGPNPAVLGRQGADTSGRALLARQQAGMIELAMPLDQMEDWEQRVYISVWQRVRQYWDGPMVIRVTDDPETPKFIGINEPIPNPQAGQPVVDPQTGQPVMQTVPHPMIPGAMTSEPMMQPDILGYKNAVAEMDVDITIDTQPATATVMAEQLENLMKLAGASPAFAQSIPPDVIVDLMPLPRKSQILAKIKAHTESQQQAQQQAQSQEIDMKVKEAMAQYARDMSTAELNRAKTDQIRAETVGGAIKTEGEAHERAHNMVIAGEEPKEAPEAPAA